MRAALIALLLLTACAPPAPPASQPSADPPAAQSAPSADNAEPQLTWADVANDPQLIGHWTANANETLASFGGDATPAFTFGCERGFMQIERIFSRPHGLAFGAGTPFNILIPRNTTTYSASASTEGRLWLVAPRLDPRLDDLAASTDGFAIQTAGDTTRFRHDPMLARVLANCRAR